MKLIEDDGLGLFRQLRRLAFVPRWVIFPRLKEQSVAEHSFHVASISLWLLDYHEETARDEADTFVAATLAYAITHDADEAITGDTPSPSKKPKMDRPQHEILVKVADGLEALAYLMEESMRGNETFVAPVREDVVKRTKPYWDLFEWDGAAHGRKPDFLELLRLFRPTVVHPVYKHPVIEAMAMEAKD